MKEWFTYLSNYDRKRIKITIANLVYHTITKKILEVDFNKELVNSINRMKIAEEVSKGLYKRLKKYYKVERDFELYELENDLAEFIDYKIPRQYFIALRRRETGELSNSVFKEDYFGINTEGLEGLIYLYEDNYIRDKESSSYIIRKKISERK